MVHPEQDGTRSRVGPGIGFPSLYGLGVYAQELGCGQKIKAEALPSRRELRPGPVGHLDLRRRPTFGRPLDNAQRGRVRSLTAGFLPPSNRRLDHVDKPRDVSALPGDSRPVIVNMIHWERRAPASPDLVPQITKLFRCHFRHDPQIARSCPNCSCHAHNPDLIEIGSQQHFLTLSNASKAIQLAISSSGQASEIVLMRRLCHQRTGRPTIIEVGSFCGLSSTQLWRAIIGGAIFCGYWLPRMHRFPKRELARIL